MMLEHVPEAEHLSKSSCGLYRCVLNGLLLCVGDMRRLDDYMQGMSINLMAQFFYLELSGM